MTLADLLTGLESVGIRLRVRLVVEAPLGVVTPQFRAAIEKHKPLLMYRLAQQGACEELATWRWAGAQAATQVADQPSRP
jgi:hypothetical protein